MRKRMRLVPIVVALLIVLLGAAIDLLINYASATVPEFIRKNSLWLWIIFGVCALLAAVLSVWQPAFSITKTGKISQKTPSKLTASALARAHDVFISYSSDDGDWVHGVLRPELESRGFSVITDRDFRAGSLSIDQMAEAVEKSNHVIAVMTPSYMASHWTKFERAMAQTLDPDASMRKLVPVLKEDCTPSTDLSVLVYRRLRDRGDWDLLAQDLM